MMACIAICREIMLAMALQAGRHGVGSGGVGGGVALCTADACGSMAAMVKVHIGGQRSTAQPNKRLARVDGRIRVGSSVKRQQACIIAHNVAVTLQTSGGMRHTGTGGGSSPGMAAQTRQVDFMSVRVGGVVKGYALRLLCRQGGIGMAI